MHLSGLLWLTSLAAVPVALSSSNAASIVPGKYIVEFEASQGSITPSDFYENLTESGLDASHQLELSNTLFSGVSFSLNDQDALNASVDKIASMRIVKNIWPVRVYDWPVVNSSTLNLSAAVQSGVQGRQEQGYAPHIMGGVDKLHAEGFTGKGIFVAIVDTGVDYNHPALGGGFGPGFKFAHGYDFVGDDYTGFNTPIPDPDPYTNCEPHGTHVSGIIGADENPWNFTGVVPDATLGMYRVGGCQGGPGSDVIIAAFLKAQEDGADVITASIGGSAGWIEDALAVAISRIVAHGTPCSLAAGNEGAAGAFNPSEPGIGIDVLSVGSVDSITSPGWNMSIGSFAVTTNENSTRTSGEFFYVPGIPGDFQNGVLPLWMLQTNSSTPIDPCAPFPEGTPNLSNKLVLMESTPACLFEVLADHAADFGAKYIFFYRKVEEVTVPWAGDNPPIDAIGKVSIEQATSWISLLKAGHKIEITITGKTGFFTYDNEVTGGYMSTFSSWSPSFDMYMKPQVSAPGRNILSTYPLAFGGYAVESGTSMATPYIGGVIALMKQIRGKLLQPKTITSIIGNSAKPRYFNDGGLTEYSFLAPTFQQGGGLVDAYAAAHMDTILSTSSMLLNDTAHFNDVGRFSIQNTGSQPVSYSVAHQHAGTAYTLPSGGMRPSTFPPDFAAPFASLEVTPQSITVPAGGSADIAVKFRIPMGLDRARLPIYSGFIVVNGTNGDVLTLPYGGLAADLKSAAIVNTQEGYPFLASSSDSYLKPVPAGTVFTLPKFNGSIPANETSYPQVAWILAMGSAYSTADIVPVTENFTCTTETGRTTLAVLGGFPQYYVARDEVLFGQYSGSNTEEDSLPSGNYTILVRALRIFGNESVEADYDVACTDHFIINYA